VPGEDSLQAIARFFEADLQQRDRACVFSFGTNDVVAGVPQEQSLGALEAALTRCDELGINAVLVLPPAIAGLPVADRPLAELCDGFAQLAVELGVAVISARELLPADGAWYSEAQAADGAHPQAAGYAELAEVLAAAGLPQLLNSSAQR